MSRDDIAYEKLATSLCEEFHKKQGAGLLANLEKRNLDALEVSREKILENMKSELGQYEDENGQGLSDEDKQIVLELIRKDLWGYGLIDDLIHESDISDIKLYSPENVRIKRTGKRYGSDVTFSDVNYYKRFVNKICERNKVNLGTANAIQTFTDATQEDFILRITIISGLLTDSGLPLVAIRKVPKTKFTLRSLEDAGMFNHKASGNGKKKLKINFVPKFFSEENAVLNELMFKMIASKGILFTGKGASGKTTLMNLLMRFYDTDSGSILVDGKDIRDYGRKGLRQRFGMVLQDTWIKSATVRENIAFGKNDATDQDIHEAARLALADGFIKKLPEGYDTFLGECDDRLSQGQKQLISIARVFLSKPEILILDEATSSIDTRTEIKVQEAFDKLMNNRTSIVVAHRLSTVENADRIIVMDKGRIVEEGSHKQLLETGGFYHSLYNSM